MIDSGLIFCLLLLYIFLNFSGDLTDVRSVINISVYLLLVLPAQGKHVSQQVTQLLRNLIQSEASIFMQFAATFICCKTDLNVGGKTLNIAIRHVLRHAAFFNTSCTFFGPYYRSLTHTTGSLVV